MNDIKRREKKFNASAKISAHSRYLQLDFS